MNRVVRAAATVILLAILVPLLVLSSAAVGPAPRHWSGVSLSGWELPLVDARPRQEPGTVRAPHLDAVTDRLIARGDGGWQAVVPLHDGSVYVETTRLDPSLFAELGRDFGGDRVSVVYAPLAPQVSPDGGGGVPAQTLWQRTDPLVTWATLMFGFPWQLGAALLLTAVAYVVAARARRRRAAGTAAVPAG
ncbi:hypothetical protein [Catellatospora sp. NPDC049609]|uniref:hypothetical protein n=1 Tax=Catellatospora sp. NPDC049609 TaxID=3155505 RepID=UPI003443FA35